MTVPQRIIAIDWSGDKGAGQKKKIWTATWTTQTAGRGKVDGGSITLVAGRTRAEVIAWLLDQARETPAMVVGIDCCFSYPAWFLEELGCATVWEFWRYVAAGAGERWLAAGTAGELHDTRFWGRPHKRPVAFSGAGLPTMMRRTDMDNKIDQGLPGGDPVRAALMAGVQPKSPFQIGGAGAVGTGSLRAMEWLERLRAAGFRVWPFEAAEPTQPLLVEIYTRLLTGPVRKANPAARRAYLKRRRAAEPLYAGLSRAAVRQAEDSEDGFDALVCCVEMVRHRAEFGTLRATEDDVLKLEGITWRPGL